MQLPGVQSQSLTPVLARLTGWGREESKAIVVSGCVRDSGSTPTHRIRAGAMLVKSTAGFTDTTTGVVVAAGEYVQADNAYGGDRNTQATVTTKLDISSWNTKTFIYSVNGITMPTITGVTADTAAQMVIDLNADENFNANLKATASGSKVVITSRRADTVFKVLDGTINDVGGAEATLSDNVEYTGTFADYVITDEWIDLHDFNDSSISSTAQGFPVGCFVSSAIRNSTYEGRRNMERRGSEFR